MNKAAPPLGFGLTSSIIRSSPVIWPNVLTARAKAYLSAAYRLLSASSICCGLDILFAIPRYFELALFDATKRLRSALDMLNRHNAAIDAYMDASFRLVTCELYDL
eukprot:CAMPEP_0178679540 /NCGR_PEP_ID=MMETSP0699-20121125/237_1 /TAXON_ID=265572 /ORGANISM="Extubocellulus spinifer, Strain CCMP396" /LENGTH=105 /DNA_ID=CAMNT_0020323899 /DNA_START=330 /DNA_END=647 /DNA_ORIENTATION=+